MCLIFWWDRLLKNWGHIPCMGIGDGGRGWGKSFLAGACCAVYSFHSGVCKWSYDALSLGANLFFCSHKVILMGIKDQILPWLEECAPVDRSWVKCDTSSSNQLLFIGVIQLNLILDMINLTMCIRDGNGSGLNRDAPRPAPIKVGFDSSLVGFRSGMFFIH